MQELAQLKRSRGAHRGVLTRRATAIRQAGGALEDVQATLEFLIDRRKMLTELDSQIQQLIEEDDEIDADEASQADSSFIQRQVHAVGLLLGPIYNTG